MRKLMIALLSGVFAVIVGTSFAGATEFTEASFSSPAAQENFQNYGDLTDSDKPVLIAAAVEKGMGQEVEYRSAGCSTGCSTGCSYGCSYGCSSGCSSGCSIGCRRF